MAPANPATNAIIPRRTVSIRCSRSPTAIAASGPNSGPTTIAPTIVIGELVAMPIAASRHASTMNVMKTPVSVESSPVLEMTSSQMTASAASPGALRSARRTPSPIAVARYRRGAGPIRNRASQSCRQRRTLPRRSLRQAPHAPTAQRATPLGHSPHQAASRRRNARPGPVSDPSSGHSDGNSQRAEEAGDIGRRPAEITPAGRGGPACPRANRDSRSLRPERGAKTG